MSFCRNVGGIEASHREVNDDSLRPFLYFKQCPQEEGEHRAELRESSGTGRSRRRASAEAETWDLATEGETQVS